MLFVDGVTLDINSSIRVDGVHLLTSWPLHPRASERGAPHPRASKRGAPYAAVLRDVPARHVRFLLCRRFVQRPKQLRHLDLVVQVINFAFDGLFQPITRLGGVPREAMLSFDERSAKYIRGEGRAEYCRLLVFCTLVQELSPSRNAPEIGLMFAFR